MSTYNTLQREPFWNGKREAKILFILFIPFFMALLWFAGIALLTGTSPSELHELSNDLGLLAFVAVFIWGVRLFVRAGLRLLS